MMLPEIVRKACAEVTKLRVERVKNTDQYFEDNKGTIREQAIKQLTQYIKKHSIEENEIYDFNFTRSGLTFVFCKNQEDLDDLRTLSTKGLKVEFECIPIEEYTSNFWLSVMSPEEIYTALKEWRKHK